MHISPINKTQEANTNFKKLKMNNFAKSYVKTLPEKEVKLIESWKEKLANTKFFDILVNGNRTTNTLYTFLFDKNTERLYQFGLVEIHSHRGNNLKIAIRDGNRRFCEADYLEMNLKFKSKKRATEAKQKLDYYDVFSSDSLINRIGRAVNAVQVLEEAKTYENLSTWDKIKVKLGFKKI